MKIEDSELDRGSSSSSPSSHLKKKRVLLLCPYPHGIAPGQRFRYEQYLSQLAEAGIEIRTKAFLDSSSMKILYRPNHFIQKIGGVLKGFVRRLVILPSIFHYDFIFIFREATPMGPPLFEFILFLLKRKVIYDFDDAIFVAKSSDANRIAHFLKFAWKVPYIVKHSYKVSVCNPYLVQWASKLNPRTVLLPTSIDPTYHRNLYPKRNTDRLTIGWTGSRTTTKHLEIVRPALRKLQEKYDFEFKVICDKDPNFNELKRYRFIEWTLKTEIEDLSQIDIGIMPVTLGPFELGKVGFKAIQYSALGIPSVVSNVGSGVEVVDHGKTGLLVENTTEAWIAALSSLLENKSRLQEMGAAAKERILSKYSVPALTPIYISLFDE